MKRHTRLRLRRLASATWRWSWLLTLPLTAAWLLWARATWTRWQAFGVRHACSEDFSLARVGAYEAKHLARALRVSLLGPPPARALRGSGLRQVHLFIDRAEQQRLDAALPASGMEYVEGALAYDGAVRRVEARYRGDNSYHWAHHKKSWRIKTEEDRLFHTMAADGTEVAMRRFNLLVPRTDELLNNHLSYRLASVLGLLAPHSEPVVLAVNGRVSGLHVLVEQPEELTMRRSGRMPGDLYSGELIGRDRLVGAPPDVFRHPGAWSKLAVNGHYPEAHDAPLRALLTTLEDVLAGRPADLADVLDLEAFARFAAWEALICTTHIDEVHNWRLYYDPWRRHFEPMAWDGMGWTGVLRRRPGVDLRPDVLSSKLHVALHRDARFLRAKQRVLREFLAQDAEAFLAEVDATIARVRAGLPIDPNLEADLSVLDPTHVRRELDALRTAIADTFEGLAAASSERGRVTYAVLDDGSVRLSVEGRRPVERVVLVRDQGPAEPFEGAAEVRWSTGREERTAAAGLVVTGERTQVELGLLPAVRARLASLRPSDVLFNRLELAGATYDVRLPEPARLGNLVDVLVERGDGPEPAERVALETLGERPGATLAGFVLPPPTAPVVWTGDVVLDGFTLVEGPLRIAPGARVRLAPDASVEVRGRVVARGTAEHPIRFEPLADDGSGGPWGAFTIQGRRADDSELVHCIFRGGSGWKSDLGESSAMLSVHDVRGLEVTDSIFEDSHAVDDMVHVVYGGAHFERCVFRRAVADALDLEMSSATVVGCRFEDSGHDGIDLMGSVVRIEDCEIVRAGDKGVSIGEGTRARVARSRIEGCAIGALVQDASAALFVDVEITGGPAGLEAHQRDWRYRRGARIWLERVRLTELEVPYLSDRRSSIEVCPSGAPEEARQALGELVDELAP